MQKVFRQIEVDALPVKDSAEGNCRAAHFVCEWIADKPNAVLLFSSSQKPAEFLHVLSRVQRRRKLDFGQATFYFSASKGICLNMIGEKKNADRLPVDVQIVVPENDRYLPELFVESRHRLVLAFGEDKADVVASFLEGVPAEGEDPFPVFCSETRILFDEAAAAKLKLKDYYRWISAGQLQSARTG